MICPKCKNALPEDSRFCQYCGATLTPVELRVDQPEKQKKPKKKVKIWAIVLAAVLVLALGFGGIYYGNYRSAIKLAEAGDYSGAQAKLMFPAITNWHDPQLADYLNEGVRLKSGLLAGYRAIASMSDEGYKVAINGLPAAKQEVYSQAVELYNAGESIHATVLFWAIDPYLDSNKYLTLLEHDEYLQVLKIINFANAKEVLIKEFAYDFLLGHWITKDGQYYFNLKKQGDGYYSDYNFQAPDVDDPIFMIEDGVYYLFNKKDYDELSFVIGRRDFEKWDILEFSIIDLSSIKVYCFDNGEYYTLYRQ